MAFKTLKLKPGVDTEESAALDAFQITTSNLIRFYAGLVQPLGGWQQKTPQMFVGTCSGLHGWADIVGNPYLAIGTDQRLQVLESGAIVDITPIISTSNIAVAFSTQIGSASVTIEDADTSPNVGDWIYLATQVSVGGIVLFGYYLVQSVIDGTHYTVVAASPATGTITDGGAVPSYTTTNTQPHVNVTLANHGLATGATFNAAVSTTVATIVIFGIYSVTFVDANNFTITGGSNANAGTTASENAGDAQIAYLLPSGTVEVTAQTGYGIGDYGAGDYGIGSTGQILAPARQWSLDHWGQFLIASPSGGEIYYWNPPDATVPAVEISDTAPAFNLSVFVMPQAQIIVSLGAEVGDTLQPLLIRWCDDGDFTDWDASATNQAGSYLVPTGSMLVGGLAVGLGAIFWTDVGFWTMSYLGFPLVFGFNSISSAGGLVAQRAAGVTPAFVMWLSLHQFFQYAFGGGVTPIECSVWDFYFYNVDKTQLSLIHCAPNTVFNEMAWHFPISESSPLWNPLAPFAYVKYNYVERVWDFGISAQYQRTASINQSPMGGPIGADLGGLIQEHEVGFDANGASMQWSWLAGYLMDGEGEEFLFSDWLIPDFVVEGNSPNVQPLIQTIDFSSNLPPTQVVVPSIQIGTTSFVTYQARGRGIAFGFAAAPSNLGSFCRLGGVRIRIAPDGKF